MILNCYCRRLIKLLIYCALWQGILMYWTTMSEIFRGELCKSIGFKLKQTDKARTAGCVIDTQYVTEKMACIMKCSEHPLCNSVNFEEAMNSNNFQTCELNYHQKEPTCSKHFFVRPGFSYYELDADMKAPWVKIGNACVGTRNNTFKEITVHFANLQPVGAIKLEHTHGFVGCKPSKHSFWGCGSNDVIINIYVTDSNNQVIYPSPRLISREEGGWYKLPGYTSSSRELVFTDIGYPKYLQRGDKIRIWYGEDLFDNSESDNHGTTCMNISAYLLPI